jgi:hypothetical protein
MVCYFGGYRIRELMIARDIQRSHDDLKTINGMLLGLLGLLLAFTFSMSNSRFDDRRHYVVEEANTIGTTVLRTDVYPDSMRSLLRATLKEYVEERIAFYEVGMNRETALDHYQKAEALGLKTWHIAANYARVDDITTRTSELLPSLNAMIDIAASRRAAGEGTIPDSIMYFLFVLCFVSSFLLGYDHHGKPDWIVVVGFAIMLSATVFYIIDLDRPRSGMVNMDSVHQKIVDLRGMFE